jgi:hypothetical protein
MQSMAAVAREDYLSTSSDAAKHIVRRGMTCRICVDNRAGPIATADRRAFMPKVAGSTPVVCFAANKQLP